MSLAAFVRVVTAAHALEPYNQPFAPDANTRGLWHFDDGPVSSTVADAGANGNHGTFATGFTDELDPTASWVSGQPGFGTALSTYWNSASDKNNGPLNIDQYPGHDSLGFTGDLTIEFWMAPSSTGAGSGQNLVKKFTGGNYGVTYHNQVLHFGWYSSGWQTASDTTAIPTGTWTHVAVLVDRESDPANDIITFYLNGAQSSQHVSPLKGGSVDTEDAWMLGRQDGHPHYHYYGLLDELRISDVLRDYGGSGGTPTAAFTHAQITTAEHVGDLALRVTLNQASGQEVRVPYTIGAATNAASGGGVDYDDPTPAGELVFAPFTIEQAVTVPLVHDTEEEDPETITLVLGAPTGATLGVTTQLVLTVLDAPHATPGILIHPARATVEEGDGVAQFTVQLSQASYGTVEVAYALSGTAVGGGTDYDPPTPPSPLVFARGEVEKIVTIPLADDGIVEPDKTVKVELHSPAGGFVSRRAVHRLAILDDDAPTSGGATWLDDFYSFRVPFTVTVPAPGAYTLDLTPAQVTAWMNEASHFAFDAGYFHYDGIRLVEVDGGGMPLGDPPEAGFELLPAEELIQNGGFEQQTGGLADHWALTHADFKVARTSFDGSWCMTVTGADRNSCGQNVPAESNTWYHISYWVEGDASVHPMVDDSIVGLGLQPIRHDYTDTYIPAVGWHPIERIFFTGDMQTWSGNQMSVRMERRTGSADNISLRRCDTAFVLEADSAGSKRFMLYYAPVEGTTTTGPSRRRTDPFPATALAVTKDGAAEWLDEGVAYRVASDASADLWYAASIRKVLPDAAPPAASSNKIALACARNETEALQLIFSPKANGQVTSVQANLAGPGGTPLPAESFDVRLAAYVPITMPSQAGTGSNQFARSAFTGDLPDPLVTFEPAAYTTGGTNLQIWIDIAVPTSAPPGLYTGMVDVAATTGSYSIPLQLTVWGFALPDRPTFRSAVQLARYANGFLFPWHKVTTSEDKYALSRAYIAEVARYRWSVTAPHAAASWHPSAPAPYVTDAYGWEFPWAFNEQYITGGTIGHVSGNHLADTTPAEAAAKGAEYEPIADYLVWRGWIDETYIQIDEPQPHAYPGVATWIDGFRGHPNAQYVRMFGFVYHGQVWDGLRDHLDIFVPIDNENASSLSRVGAAMVDPAKEVWAYWTKTSHTWIDAPSLGHRLWAPKVRWAGGEGLSSWAILKWWIEGTETYNDNPWVDPWTPWGNGLLAWFYPPDPAGLAIPAKDMTITPSLRLLLARDSVEDDEYGVILESLIEEIETQGGNTAGAVTALVAWDRMFVTPRSWHLGEAYYLAARARAARAIETLIPLSAPPRLNLHHEQGSSSMELEWSDTPGSVFQPFATDGLNDPQAWSVTNGTSVYNAGTMRRPVQAIGAGGYFRLEAP